MPRYAITRCPTPVLITPHFRLCFGGGNGAVLPLDEQKLLRPIEIVLFPKSKVELLEKLPHSSIWRIRTNEHSCPKSLYIDERFVKPVENASERERLLPPVSTLLNILKAHIGIRYIWGGNWPKGIPQLLQWYKPTVKNLDALVRDTWQLKGVDCSGLLYFASNGFTPRNTVDLVSFGKGLLIEGKSIDEIVKSVAPLDIIVWQGHVVLILDSETAIESKVEAGVVASPLKERLQEIMRGRKPVNSYKTEESSFVLRRWHPEI